MVDVALHINMRASQLKLYNERKRFAVRVIARRSGKTWLAIAELVMGALTTTRPDARMFYVAPTYRSAKRIAFDILKQFVANIPAVTLNESELRADFPNGSRIQLLGGETYELLRGIYIDQVVMDECAQIPSAAWSQVIRPALADRNGTAVLMGTPAGRHNLLFDLYDYATTARDPEWSAHLMNVNEVGELPPNEVKAMRREMSDAEFQQELMCSFNAAVRGAYYAKEMNALQERGQVTQVRYDAAAPVYVALDLGWSDLMVCHFIQPVGTEHHFLLTKAYAETKLADMCNDWKSLPFQIDHVILPHDAVQHELTSGTTRENLIRGMGHETSVAPRVKTKHEGIEQVRHLLPHCWFDDTECKTTVEALFHYHSDYDEVRRVVKLSPVHDWSSHYVDAVHTYATGRPNHTLDWSQYPKSLSPSKSLRF